MPTEFVVQGPGGGPAGAPTAGFTHSANGLTLTFSDTSKAVAPKTIITAAITWGDGSSDTIKGGSATSHTYNGAGNYRIVEIVTDSAGLTDQASTTVNVQAPTGTGGGGGGGAGGGGTGGGTSGGGGGGGTGSPAAGNGQYVITSQSQTIQVVASGQVIDVEQVGFQTIPHNAFAQVYVPLADWQAGNTANYVNPVAAAIEQILTQGYAASASYVQDVDPTTSLLTGYEDFVVSYTPAGSVTAMTTHVRIPISQLAAGAQGAPINALQTAAQRLQSTAGL